VIERGKDVRGRRRFKTINVDHIVNEDSNYCFGGAERGLIAMEVVYPFQKKRRCDANSGVVGCLWCRRYFSG
jgi:hypothetical protein